MVAKLAALLRWRRRNLRVPPRLPQIERAEAKPAPEYAAFRIKESR